ncbi:testis-expressed protein 2 isoform X2 [Latimeria chalumnae]|uniref:testis-expressed protein 2 isoform X2 n=1 Tax=Latimeria chalumnae TaxID=7897 RepID=UPI0003C19694|nr:PREDICTED: testis-expressed sequence 2 protein isoform X2 [Latimeria chalumnae]|eukprot:XP_005993802.1 PREDICTED: testis-expressed sequence 2 protein isoform X2 [Latimeria chalumnae]
MTSQSSSHADKTGPMSSKQSAPKLQVQRSISRETITIRFSALGKEEEEEEKELESYEELNDQSILTALEAKEDLSFEHGSHFFSGPSTSNSMAVAPTTSVSSLLPSSVVTSPVSDLKPLEPSALLESTAEISSVVPSAVSSSTSCSAIAVSSPVVSLPSENIIQPSSSMCSSQSKSVIPLFSVSTTTMPSAKPFISLVKSLSIDVEPKETIPSLRHRHLMKTLVKSLSSDTSKQESEPVFYRSPDSKLNLHLFKQFTQPRVTGGDSKTAPSSPLTSPSDSRSFFKVTEVEAKIEDTKRRLSEVIYEPFQLLSKIIGDETSSHRTKALSSSASELSNLSSLNGHVESNNNYSIKEEEWDSESDCPTNEPVTYKTDHSRNSEENTKEVDTKISVPPGSKEYNLKPSPLALEKCSLSALASKEDEEFCELYSEDFDLDLEEETSGDVPVEVTNEEVHEKENAELTNEDKIVVQVQQPKIPLKTLFFFIILAYVYLVLPLPNYLSGLILGVALGFMIGIGVVWLITPRNSPDYHKIKCQSLHDLWNTGPLDIKEPEIFKGWMNEISSYDPETYHATLTHSVFVRLEGATVRLSKPNKNISRRASFNESKPEVTYVSQKIYDLTDSKIYLVPKSLARKRIWNKKYPICIELGKQDDFMSKAQMEKETIDERSPVEKTDLESEEHKNVISSQDGRKFNSQKDQVLYLFGRTGREKEEWFRRFLLASKLKSEPKKSTSLPGNKPGFIPSHSRNNSQSGILTHSRNSSKGSMEEIMPQPKQKDLVSSVRQKMLLDYTVYMAKYIPQETKSPVLSPVHSADSSPTVTKKLPSSHTAEGEEQEAWVNALLGRIFWDFLGEKYWSDLVSKKIQMKLSKIRLPYFMNELTLTELDMGVAVPKILQASKPTINHQGLWFNLEISYNGSFLMSLETKMNLTRLGKEPPGESLKVGEIGKEGPRAYCLADSDEESSSAGSSDEEDAPEFLAGEKPIVPGMEGYVGGHRASKIMRFVDKITKSKYFQKATETEFIKKKIEEVSNTPLLLSVEVQECKGTLAVNIPPPPTDRIWYGFRQPPHLELKARPKLGEREVTLAHVTDWIEKKLEQEFQKIFVMPNMDDVYIPIMHSAMDPRSSTMSPLKEPIEAAARL